MRILIVRHGDPDYVRDNLTEKGKREAEYLSQRLIEEEIDAFYVSPLGRAQATIVPTLQKLQTTAIEQQWLREFDGEILRPDRPEGERIICWDWLPADWTKEEEFYSKDQWHQQSVMQEGEIEKKYHQVTMQLDRLLARYGYERNGLLYDVTKRNHDTICLVCHFGLECVLLSHLLNISPMQLWHGMCAAPSSVTTLYTEERRDGVASWRMQSFGDVSHLYANGEKPAFAARFCECYHDGDRED